MAVGAHRGPLFYCRGFQHAAGLNEHLISDFAVDNHAVGSDAGVTADAGGTAQLDERLDNGVRPNRDVAANQTGWGTKDGDAVGTDSLARAPAPLPPEF